MRDDLAARYEAVPYRHGAIAHSHPARLGAIARLHGVAAAPPDRCRVLELGCGEGMNLLPLAERLPDSEFLGLDLSARAIEVGEEARVTCGLDNARLLCADLRTWEPDGTYDYVIAHGVYSWVAEEVRERLLEICARALGPHSVAYLSYNTLPGWGLPGALRTFLLEETSSPSQTVSPASQIDSARGILAALGSSAAHQSGPYSAYLQATVQDMLAKPPALFFHDDLAPLNEPCTFTAFVRHAAAHGLHYLAEAHYATMQYQHVPPAMRAPLAGLQLDFLREQQYMDVLFQRWLRNSLLLRTALPPDRPLFPEVIRGCALGLRLQFVDSSADLRPGAPLRLRGSHDVALEFTDPEEKALLIALVQAAPQRLAWGEAVQMADAHLQRAGLPHIGDEPGLCALLFRLFALDVLDVLLLGEGAWLSSAKVPAPSALMRYEAARGLSITNRWHEPVGVTAEGQRWLLESRGESNAAARQAGFLV